MLEILKAVLFGVVESCVNPTYITDEEYRQHLVKVISFIGMIVEDKGDYYDLFVDKKIQKVVEELKALQQDVTLSTTYLRLSMASDQ